MDIRHPKEQELAAVKALWASSFEKEDEPFFQWFFTHRYQAANALGVFAGTQLQAGLHVAPYTIRLRGEDVRAAYVLGVATLPEYRRQGLMRSLLAFAVQEMRQRGQWVSILLPRVPSIYRRHGWEICYHTYKYSIPSGALPAGGETGFREIGAAEHLAELDAIYRSYMQRYHGYVCRNKEHWQSLLAEHCGEGGKLYMLELGGRPAAYAMTVATPSRLFIKEMGYTSTQARQSLFSFIGTIAADFPGAEWQLPLGDPAYLEFADNKEDIRLYPFTAGRIIDIVQALGNYTPPAALEGTVAVAVTDEIAPWNQGVFQLTVKNGRLYIEKGTDADVHLTIGAFSQLFFGRLGLADLLAAGSATVVNPDAAMLLDRMFPCLHTALCETF